MKSVVVGILAHVDAGKTTLSEALLYKTGTLRKLGRVDHGDAFLDTDTIERERGITIYSEPAHLTYESPIGAIAGDDDENLDITLLDTPGHVDFSAETERTLRVLDYAILVVSGVDGVQGHTETLWHLLRQHHVPTFIFVNKMDSALADKTRVMNDLRTRLTDGDACIDCSTPDAVMASLEDIAMRSEAAMDEYLDSGTLSADTLRTLIADNSLFPCFFGSALKLDGIDEFFRGFAHLTKQPDYPDVFGARVYKISHDAQGNRLTWLKVTGGQLNAKQVLTNERVLANGEVQDAADICHEKADQVRLYSGAKYEIATVVPAGGICAVSGPTRTFAGEGLGFEADAAQPTLQPVLTFTLEPHDHDIHACLVALRELEDEDPLLHVVWQAQLEEIHVQLMGTVQLEIIQRVLHDRFGLDITFGAGSILYKETINTPVEGVGHFEPLRHYAEAHVLIEPLPAGSGIQIASAMNYDELDRNWQRLILTHFVEREHAGVLTGAPLTDVKLTLVAARAHLKHTEGGDFRQATYRAIRQGLMEARAGVPTDASALEIAERFTGDTRDELEMQDEQEQTDRTSTKMQSRETSTAGSATDTTDTIDADQPTSRIAGIGNCVLLEPWYAFRLDVPEDMLGRALADIQRMSGTFDTPAIANGYAHITGSAPASEMRDYAVDVATYSRGLGHITLTFDSYQPCHDTERLVAQAHYDPESDLENTPDSVFCAHGAGYPVKWYKVPEFMHLSYASSCMNDVIN